MGFNTDLMTGFAQLFDDAGIGTFSTEGVYADTDTAIFLGLTPATPARAITLMAYPVEDTDLTNVVVGLQIRFRGGRDPREVEDLSDAVYDLLHNRSNYDVNGVHVLLSWRQSGSWLGQDEDQRVERSENFYLRAERAAPNQIP